MIDIDTAKKIAVLIDAENASLKALDTVLTELSKHGHIIVKKAYGDWSSKHLINWPKPLNDMAITPVQQFAYTQKKKLFGVRWKNMLTTKDGNLWQSD